MDHPNRKQIRIPDFDYSSHGAYFVTICTHNRKMLFGQVGEQTAATKMLEQTLAQTLCAFPQITCPKYVIMPNHIHAILMVDQTETDPGNSIIDVIRVFKSKSTVAYIRLVREGKAPAFDKHVWQRSFYDHAIRNETDYEEIWNYIDTNPLRWKLKKTTK